MAADFDADLSIEERIIVEKRAISELTKNLEVQVVNYRIATGKDVSILINFDF